MVISALWSTLSGQNRGPYIRNPVYLVVFPDVRAERGEDASDGGDDGEGEGDADHGVHDAEQPPARRHRGQVPVTYIQSTNKFNLATIFGKDTTYCSNLGTLSV